jgi:hypothetical protein
MWFSIVKYSISWLKGFLWELHRIGLAYGDWIGLDLRSLNKHHVSSSSKNCIFMFYNHIDIEYWIEIVLVTSFIIDNNFG